MRFWSSAVSTLPVTCAVVAATRRPNSRFSSVAEAVAVGFGGGFRLGEDLLGLGDGFLGFLLGEGGGTLFGFVDQADGLFIGLGDGGGGGGLGLGELFLDALELFLALGDARAALLEHRLDRAEREFLQQDHDDQEIDHTGR